MKIKIEFTEPLLGTLSGNKELAEEFIVANHPEKPQADEIEALPETLEKSSTIFARNAEGKPILWDYQIKGFFKDAAGMLNRASKSPLKAYKKVIDGLVFVKPRQIVLNCPSAMTWTERPLRAQTAQGERVALARSETAPAGTTFEIEIVVLAEKLNKNITDFLDYGALRGIGQWRNSGMGRFIYKVIE